MAQGDSETSGIVKAATVLGGGAIPAFLANYSVPSEGITFSAANWTFMIALAGFLISGIIVLYNQLLASEARHREYVQDLLDQTLGITESTVDVVKTAQDLDDLPSPRKQRRKV